jgi:hypothetical protein
MRALIFQAIVSDPTISGFGVTEAGSFATDVDTPAQRPFLQLRWGRTDFGLDVVTVRTLNIWVHDEPGDYGRIDSIILRLRELLPTLEGQSNGSGHLVAVEWAGDSEDLADDGHKTITRYSTFTLVGSGQ